jgi:putative sugar O-methyltransferase
VNVSLSYLERAYDDAVSYVGKVTGSGLMDEHVSGFWAEILAERGSYPSFPEMLTMRRGATYPMAERRDVADEEAETAYARAAHFVATKSIPPASRFLDELEEPAFGCPQPFDVGAKLLTPNCLVNAITVHRVLEALRRAGIEDRPLRVLEIGAGFGQAARQLLERLDISTYAICDLPENLFLSAFYLRALFPERTAAFVGDGETGVDSGLAFVVPPAARELAGPFDLILNSYSFQEMNRRSVEEYFALASRTLSDDGVFYSLNAHGKDEIAWPSEYPVEQFELEHVASPRRFPFQLNATVPYELVLRRPRATTVTRRLKSGLDAIGSAFQLGLDEEIAPLCDRFVAGTPAAGEAEWIAATERLFRASDADEKRHRLSELDRSGVLPAVVSYLTACFAYATGDRTETIRAAEASLPGLAQSLARLHAETMLAKLGHDTEGSLARTAALAPHLADQIAGVPYEVHAAHIGACLHLPPASVSAQEPDALSGRIRRTARRIGPARIRSRLR